MALRNAFADLAEEATLEDVVHLLAVIASKLPEKDGARALMTGPVTASGTVTATQGSAGTAAWRVQMSGDSGLDPYYQSTQAFESVRSRITVA